MNGDEWTNGTSAGDGSSPTAAPQAPPAPRAPPADPREHYCHCGQWGMWGNSGQWRCHEHRAEIGYDHACAWRGLRSALFMSLVLGSNMAHATMPVLTEEPRPASPATCRQWAAKQDEEAQYMWGIREDGTSQKPWHWIGFSL